MRFPHTTLSISFASDLDLRDFHIFIDILCFKHMKPAYSLYL